MCNALLAPVGLWVKNMSFHTKYFITAFLLTEQNKVCSSALLLWCNEIKIPHMIRKLSMLQAWSRCTSKILCLLTSVSSFLYNSSNILLKPKWPTCLFRSTACCWFCRWRASLNEHAGMSTGGCFKNLLSFRCMTTWKRAVPCSHFNAYWTVYCYTNAGEKTALLFTATHLAAGGYQQCSWVVSVSEWIIQALDIRDFCSWIGWCLDNKILSQENSGERWWQWGQQNCCSRCSWLCQAVASLQGHTKMCVRFGFVWILW